LIQRLRPGTAFESISPRSVGGPATHIAAQTSPIEEELGAAAYRQAYAEGFEAGEQDGQREASRRQEAWERESEQRLSEQLDLLVQEREAFAALTASIGSQLSAQELVMERLAFEVALAGLSRAFGALQEDGQLLARMCTQVICEHKGEAAKLAISPSDKDKLPSHVMGVEVVVAEGLAPGQCRLLTSAGYAASSLAMRLHSIHDAMIEALGLSPP
jgi:flagellar biosynthesis/type III secretory pathway protein FliH